MKAIATGWLAIMVGAAAVAWAADPQQPTKRKIKTLPMVRAGDTPSYVKSIGPTAKFTPKPPAMDPYAWVAATESGSVERAWATTGGTNFTAALVKFNRFTIVVRDPDDRELQLARKTLDNAGQNFIKALETEAQKLFADEWNARREEKREKEAAARDPAAAW